MRRVTVLGAVLLAIAGVGHAQDLASQDELLSFSRKWVQSALATAQAGFTRPLRMEFTVGAPDSRLRLTGCSKLEAYNPPGQHLWGKTRLGLRCLEGATRWNISLPVTVKALGRAWVMRRDVPAGATIADADLMEVEVDWAEEPSPVLTEVQQWQGQVANRPLATGQPLRQSMVRPAQVFQAGAQVRVIAMGAGFQVTADAQALTPGVVGQQTKVRMDSGRVMSATVLDARTVKIEI